LFSSNFSRSSFIEYLLWIYFMCRKPLRSNCQDILNCLTPFVVFLLRILKMQNLLIKCLHVHFCECYLDYCCSHCCQNLSLNLFSCWIFHLSSYSLLMFLVCTVTSILRFYVKLSKSIETYNKGKKKNSPANNKITLDVKSNSKSYSTRKRCKGPWSWEKSIVIE